MSAHAIQRARERLGLDITQADLDAVLATLGKDVTAILVKKEGNAQHWLVRLKGVLAGIVVDWRGGRRDVVTVLTPVTITAPARRGLNFTKATRAQKRRGAWRGREDRMRKRAEMEGA